MDTSVARESEWRAVSEDSFHLVDIESCFGNVEAPTALLERHDSKGQVWDVMINDGSRGYIFTDFHGSDFPDKMINRAERLNEAKGRRTVGKHVKYHRDAKIGALYWERKE